MKQQMRKCRYMVDPRARGAGKVDNLEWLLRSVLNICNFITPEIFLPQLMEPESKGNGKHKPEKKNLFSCDIHG